MNPPRFTPASSGLAWTRTRPQQVSLQCAGFPELKRKMARVTAFFSRAVLQNMAAVKDKFKIPMMLQVR